MTIGHVVAAVVAACSAAFVMSPKVLFGAALALDQILPLWLVESMTIPSMEAAAVALSSSLTTHTSSWPM